MTKRLLGILVIAFFTLGGTAADAGVAASALCKDKKGNATGKKASGILKAFGKNLKVPNTAKLALDISKAQSKFTKGFTSAEAAGGCQTTGDSGAIEAKVDAFADDVLGGLSPATTMTPTSTTTMTPMSTTTTTIMAGGGVELQGALTATTGRFNYNLTLGLPGANAACNTNFAATHACTYAELQIAEAAGDLVGLTDTASITVTSFWAIDPAGLALEQCVDDAPAGSNLNWEYGTAHTPSRGRRVDLNNGLGSLGPLQAPQQCNFSSRWVGCCL
jgi:hypothetical protein